MLGPVSETTRLLLISLYVGCLAPAGLLAAVFGRAAWRKLVTGTSPRPEKHREI